MGFQGHSCSTEKQPPPAGVSGWTGRRVRLPRGRLAERAACAGRELAWKTSWVWRCCPRHREEGFLPSGSFITGGFFFFFFSD